MTAHTRQTVLADAIENSQRLVKRFVVGFDDSTHTKQARGMPNHFAWCMGHLSLTMHRVAEAIDGKPLPDADFIDGAFKGDAKRFGSETVCFASHPTDDPAIYPTHARCTQVFDAAIERLANAVRDADDSALEKSIPWGRGESLIGELASRMVYHNGVHCGQIIDLRRALGMKSVFS